jgi:phospholipid transport system substrate-binding protein
MSSLFRHNNLSIHNIMQSIMNRHILMASATAIALAFPASSFAASAETQPIEALDNALISVMKAGNQHQSFMQRYDMLKPAVERAFNLPQILQASVGAGWSQIPQAQQAQLLKVFTQYTVASYVHSFNGYNGQSFRMMPNTQNVGGQQVVATELVPHSGTPTKLNYVMNNANGQWKATDILFDGTISKVATTRSDFSSLVQSGNANQLISVLQRKVSSLSGGALTS